MSYDVSLTDSKLAVVQVPIVVISLIHAEMIKCTSTILNARHIMYLI